MLVRFSVKNLKTMEEFVEKFLSRAMSYFRFTKTQKNVEFIFSRKTQTSFK